jgi:hypothetical protein
MLRSLPLLIWLSRVSLGGPHIGRAGSNASLYPSNARLAARNGIQTQSGRLFNSYASS